MPDCFESRDKADNYRGASIGIVFVVFTWEVSPRWQPEAYTAREKNSLQPESSIVINRSKPALLPSLGKSTHVSDNKYLICSIR